MNLENFVLTYLAHAALHSLMDGHIVLLYSIEEAMANTAIDACGWHLHVWLLLLILPLQLQKDLGASTIALPQQQ